MLMTKLQIKFIKETKENRYTEVRIQLKEKLERFQYFRKESVTAVEPVINLTSMRHQSKNEQLSTQLSRINSACRQAGQKNSLNNSNRSLLGNKSTNYEPRVNRRISQTHSQLSVSQQFQPFDPTISNSRLRNFGLNAQLKSGTMKKKNSLNINGSVNIDTSQTYNYLTLSNFGPLLVKSHSSNADNRQTTFLKTLYLKKTEDLKTFRNPKHEKIFVDRLRDYLSQTQFIASECDFGKGCVMQVCNYLTLKNIHKLVLNKNPFGDQGIKYLNQTLPRLNIKDLSLVSVGLSPKGCKALLETLKQCRSVERLDLSSFEGLSRNRLGKQSACALEQLLKCPQCNLTDLSLQNSYLSEEGFQALCNGVYRQAPSEKDSCKISVLNIAKSDIKENCMRLFAEKFKSVPLRSLNLAHNNISDEGLNCLTELLGTDYSKNTLSLNLRTLNVSSNNIHSFGLQTFAKEVVNNQILENINFNDNPLFEGQKFFNIKFFLSRNWAIKSLLLQNTLGGVQDCKSLMEGLQGNRSIEVIDISRNSLQIQAFSSIMGMLGKNKCLKKLDMNICNIADFYLAKVQRFCVGSLSQWSLQNNFINDKGAKILLKLLNDNPKIQKLSLKKNCISQKAVKEIQEALKNNGIASLNEQPDLSYYDYVKEMQNNQKTVLMSSIKRLQQKQEKERINQLMYDIAEKQVIIAETKQEMIQQAKKIESIEREISEKGIALQADREGQSNTLFATEAPHSQTQSHPISTQQIAQINSS